MPTLHLFDIDGTLVRMQGTGRIAFDHAMKRLFGKEKLTHEISMAGTTDLATFHAVMDKLGIRNGFDDYWHHFETYFAEALTELVITAPYMPIEGVVAFLELLRKNRTPRAIITGNMKKGAEIKLQSAGLSDYFTCGAYGDDALTRNDLAEIAVQRSKDSFHTDLTTIIMWGDTPLDIEAGKHIGAVTVAVAGGLYTREQLEQCSPDRIIEDFTELPDIIKHFQ